MTARCWRGDAKGFRASLRRVVWRLRGCYPVSLMHAVVFLAAANVAVVVHGWNVVN
jgi:hypothetical protein